MMRRIAVEDGVELPEHIMYEVFLNLRVKTLLRFLCLSKRWNRIISSPAFAKHHLLTQQSSSSSHHTDSLILFSHPPPRSPTAATASCDVLHLSAAKRPQQQLSPCVELLTYLPFKAETQNPADDNQLSSLSSSSSSSSWRLVHSSSCHGLFCLIYLRSDSDDDTARARIYVWNPITRRCRRVSWPTRMSRRPRWPAFVGFGYDHVIDDYKVLVRYDDEDVGNKQTYIMALKTNMWRSIDHGSSSCSWGIRYSRPVTIDGDVYWISRSRNKELVVVKFNLSSESMAVLAAPPTNGFRIRCPLHARLCQYNGLLCFYYYEDQTYLHPRDSGVIHTRTMTLKDSSSQGEAASWNKLMIVPNVRGFLCRQLYPLGFTSSDGEVIMASIDGQGILVYNDKDGTFATLKSNTHSACNHLQWRDYRNADIHFLQVESLLMLSR